MPKNLTIAVGSPAAARGLAAGLRLLLDGGATQIQVTKVENYRVMIHDLGDELNIPGYEEDGAHIHLYEQTESAPNPSNDSETAWSMVSRAVHTAFPDSADDLLHSVRPPKSPSLPYSVSVFSYSGRASNRVPRKHLDKAKQTAIEMLKEMQKNLPKAEADSLTARIHKKYDDKLIWIYPEDAPIRIAKELEEESTSFFDVDGESAEETPPGEE